MNAELAANKYWLSGENARKTQRLRAYSGRARGRRCKGLAWPGHVSPKIGAIDKSPRSHIRQLMPQSKKMALDRKLAGP
jgi:hypothetical protein